MCTSLLYVYLGPLLQPFPQSSNVKTAVATADHLAIDFDYDDFYGVPVRLQSMTATVGGEFDAEAGFEINAGEITIDIGPKQIFAGNLARITVSLLPLAVPTIYAVSLTLPFVYSMPVSLQFLIQF